MIFFLKKKVIIIYQLVSFPAFQYFPPLSPFFSLFFPCLFLSLLYPQYHQFITHPTSPSPSLFSFFLHFFSCSSSCSAISASLPHHSPTNPYPSWCLHLSLARHRPSLASPNSLVPPPLTSLTSLSLPPHPSHS
jgi:hypothetical protein